MSVANPLHSNEAFPSRDDDLTIVIFAKAPIPGRCKTRLARGVGNTRAARIYRAMLEHAVASITGAAPGRAILSCAPNTRHPFFKHLARRYGVTRYRQAQGDLGTRMADGIRRGLGPNPRGPVLVVGSDQPELGGSWLEHARNALAREGKTAWMAPTEDGGYWAIGLDGDTPRVFRGPRWSTPRVSTATRTGMMRLGFDHAEITPRNDIDELRDWQRLTPRLRTQLSRQATMPGIRFRR
ncbi:hypothetical protein SADO_15239 [Salinisphaera dokdonensis CL-ES53]|uniref:Glycosyltransferase n=1 Tax=Salinisphaera dokdonensis CL-ES53 TaxID=1304272 RepID=A0ABV2B410_9GAMM